MMGVTPDVESKYERKTKYLGFSFADSISVKMSKRSYSFFGSLDETYGKLSSFCFKAASTVGSDVP